MDSHKIASSLSLWEMGKEANSCNRTLKGRTSRSWRVLLQWEEEPTRHIYWAISNRRIG